MFVEAREPQSSSSLRVSFLAEFPQPSCYPMLAAGILLYLFKRTLRHADRAHAMMNATGPEASLRD
jgi:hypothetical protein